MRIDFQTIYVQQSIAADPQWQARADAILARFPQAKVVPVASHNRIPELTRADPSEWMQTKRESLVLGVRKDLKHKENGRSADFIAAGSSIGCLSACQYCYVARWRGGSNPLTVFANIDQIIASIRRHQQRLGAKQQPNQCDPSLWTYDIGCNADLSLDAHVCEHPGLLVEAFAEMPHAKATFATKTVHDEFWLRYDPKAHTRIRYSLMPQQVARYVDIATSKMSDRIRSINALVEAGYEVHVNFSPIIIHGEDWLDPWGELWREIDDVLSAPAKAQLACEAFFLTHSALLHEKNLEWNPKGEEYLWTPDNQRYKGPGILTYDRRLRQREMLRFQHLLEQHLPYCPVRYSF